MSTYDPNVLVPIIASLSTSIAATLLPGLMSKGPERQLASRLRLLALGRDAGVEEVALKKQANRCFKQYMKEVGQPQFVVVWQGWLPLYLGICGFIIYYFRTIPTKAATLIVDTTLLYVAYVLADSVLTYWTSKFAAVANVFGVVVVTKPTLPFRRLWSRRVRDEKR